MGSIRFLLKRGLKSEPQYLMPREALFTWEETPRYRKAP
jgi:hypothetical protein